MTIEQHPIPQDVTGFEFKLIGDMTIRQFAYLAGGTIFAYLFFKATVIPVFIRLPLAGIFGLGGVALAFFPYQGRPLDRWFVAFVTSIYRPTQYVWKKDMHPPQALQYLSTQVTQTAPVQAVPKTNGHARQKKVTQYLETLPKHTAAQEKTAHHESKMLDQVASFFKDTPKAQIKQPHKPTSATAPIPLSMGTGKNIAGQKLDLTPKEQPKAQVAAPAVDVEWKTKELNQRISKLQKELGTQTITRERFLELQKELTALLQEKEQLLQELVSLRKALEEKKTKATVRPTEYAKDTATQGAVKIVPENLAKKKGLPQLTSLPNVVTGIVKTAQGELLPNILVTVKDSDEMPVRALKTNKLGQFAASAPLANGTYEIEIEDTQKRYQFTTVEITLSGAVLPPLEIWAKGKKELTREMLYNDVFGKKEI